MPLVIGDLRQDSPTPLNNLELYRSEGRLLMQDLDECIFTLDRSTITLEITASRQRFGSQRPETLRMVNRAAFRN